MSKIIDPRIQNIVDIYGKHPETLDELAEACIRVISEKNKVVGFAWEIKYSPTVSNTHDAPIGKKTNWHRDKELPLGYPGFTGRVWIRYKTEPKLFSSSDNFDATLTYPGTGGFGDYGGPWGRIYNKVFQARNKYETAKDIEEVYCYSWDYRFYIEDFPELDIHKEITAHVLKYGDASTYEKSHYFKWNDPEQIKEDKEILDRIKRYNKRRYLA